MIVSHSFCWPTAFHFENNSSTVVVCADMTIWVSLSQNKNPTEREGLVNVMRNCVGNKWEGLIGIDSAHLLLPVEATPISVIDARGVCARVCLLHCIPFSPESRSQQEFGIGFYPVSVRFNVSSLSLSLFLSWAKELCEI